MSNFLPDWEYNDGSATCANVYSQVEDVSVAIKLNTSAKVGNLKTECCGEPTVSVRYFQNRDCTCSSEVVITQTVRTRIPIEYFTSADINSTCVKCKSNNFFDRHF